MPDQRIAALPGVASVSVSTGMPVNGVASAGGSDRRPASRSADAIFAGVNLTLPSYHTTFGIRSSRTGIFQ